MLKHMGQDRPKPCPHAWSGKAYMAVHALTCISYATGRGTYHMSDAQQALFNQHLL